MSFAFLILKNKHVYMYFNPCGYKIISKFMNNVVICLLHCNQIDAISNKQNMFFSQVIEDRTLKLPKINVL